MPILAGDPRLGLATSDAPSSDSACTAVTDATTRLALLLWIGLLIAPPAQAVDMGLGVFGGGAIPVIQEDTGGGPVLGVRVPVALHPRLTVEPYYMHMAGSERDIPLDIFTIVYDGIDVASYGTNLLLTFGGRARIFPYAGLGAFHLTRPGLDVTRTGYTFGLGLGLAPVPRWSLQARAELAAVVHEGVSRKWASVTGGISYSIFRSPR